jgi:DUF1009 family protein
MRFDIPVVGLRTVRALRKGRIAVLAVEAGRCIVLDQDKVVREADRAGISLVGLRLDPQTGAAT